MGRGTVAGPRQPPVPGPAVRNRRLLVLGQGVSLLGDYPVFFLALPVFVRDRTGSAGSLGALAAAETVAVLIFGFLAGVLIDRVRIRRAVVLADLARAAAFGLLALAVVLGADETWMAFAVASVVGSMGTVFDTGLQRYMPALLHDDDLGPTNGAIAAVRNLTMTVGTLAGGARARPGRGDCRGARLVPADLLGRVVSALRTIAFAGIAVGAAFGGLIGDWVGLRALCVGGGSLTVCVALVLALGPLWGRDGRVCVQTPDATAWRASSTRSTSSAFV